MVFRLDNIVPWGRSFAEYVRMFDLTPDELELRILGCGDGPASFNSQMNRRGNKVVSCDPIYQFNAEQLQMRIEASYEKVMAEARQNQGNFVWDSIKSLDELGRIRMAAMREFLTDFEKGKQQGRYLAESLPSLPFADREFDLALSSHFLFLYTQQLSLDFHKQSIMEICRAAAEVRIFPLIDLDLKRSRYVDAISVEMKKAGYCVEVRKVPYEFQRGGNEMMTIHSK